MRRVVTGQMNGKSVILDDAEIAGQGIFGPDLFGLWETDGIPSIPLDEKDFQKQLANKPLKPGGTSIGIFSRPPDEVVLTKAREKGIDMAEFYRKLFRDEGGMHTTDSVDYVIILSGEMWMELDDSVEVHLKPFDCVVQNGTRHAWRNKGSENCIMAVVMIGAKRK